MKKLRRRLIDKVFAEIKNYDHLLYDDLEIKLDQNERSYRVTRKYKEGSIRSETYTIILSKIYRCALNIKYLRGILEVMQNKKPFVKIEKSAKT